MGLAPTMSRSRRTSAAWYTTSGRSASARLAREARRADLEERRQMQEHSAIGERILANVDEYSEIARIVRHHHERIDGQGYPDGLGRRDPLVSGSSRRRRVQRDDLGPAVSRRDAKSRCPPAPGSGRRKSVRHGSVAAFEAILPALTRTTELATRRLQQFAQSYDEPSSTRRLQSDCRGRLTTVREAPSWTGCTSRRDTQLVVDVVGVHLHR